MPAQQNLRATGDRIEQLLDELRATADPRTCDRAEELLRLVSELYGAGLARVVELAGEGDPGLVERFVGDDLLASLLLVHGLHPKDLRRRVEDALAQVRPFLGAHGGDVELLDLDEGAGAVRLRLLGSCEGCPSSAVTLQLAVERAITEAAPEITLIDVDEPPKPVTTCPSSSAPNRSYEECPAEMARRVSDPLAVLQRIRDIRPRPVARAGERCELCTEEIADEHGHLVDLEARNLLCACRGCYLLFISEGAGGAHFRAVPDRYLAFPEFELSAAQWDSLQIPVSVAFFFLNSSLGRVAAFYPGPAGATESELPLDTWQDVVAANPTLATLQPDVEAFLVRSEKGRRRGRVLPRADRRLLRARRSPPPAVAGLRRWPGSQRPARRLLRPVRARAR